MDARALWRLGRLLRRDRPDILHAMLFHANLAARFVGLAVGLPAGRIICEIQTVEIERRWHLWLDNLTCRWCRCEIGNSPSVVNHLHRTAHIPSSRLRCEWGAVDVEAIATAQPIARPELGWPANGPILIWTGRLDPVKGFEEMLAAFRLVRQRTKASLVLVGEGPYRPVIQRLIHEQGLADCVLLMGRRSDVPRLLKSADLFLFCSRTEGLPNSLLEAMAAGLPIVATDVPGCRDVIVDMETGLLSPLGSPGKIAENVLALLGDVLLSRRIVEHARRWVGRRANLVDLADRWSRFYESVGAVSPGQLVR